jgi:hypothetical protein
MNENREQGAPQEDAPTDVPGWPKIIISGLACAVILSIVYRVVGHLGPLIGWHQRASAREWILAAIIGFLIGCLWPLRGISRAAAARHMPVDGSTLQEAAEKNHYE